MPYAASDAWIVQHVHHGPVHVGNLHFHCAAPDGPSAEYQVWLDPLQDEGRALYSLLSWLAAAGRADQYAEKYLLGQAPVLRSGPAPDIPRIE